MSRLGVRAVVAAALISILAACVALLLPSRVGRQHPVQRAESASIASTASAGAYHSLSATAIAALPEARYDAVIEGLIPVFRIASAVNAYRLVSDTALYADDRITPVARLASRNFLGQPTVVVPVESAGDWVRVLTPARQKLPSAVGAASAVDAASSVGALPPGGVGTGRGTGTSAPAQTSAWLRADSLTQRTPVTSRIVVSVSSQTLRVLGGGIRAWKVGVGAAGTPTPTGVTGYLEARYRDATQDQAEHPVQLTSLHSVAADEPFEGSDGGLIGVHFTPVPSGAASHGCIRVPLEALEAVNALPLGTLITIEE